MCSPDLHRHVPPTTVIYLALCELDLFRILTLSSYGLGTSRREMIRTAHRGFGGWWPCTSNNDLKFNRVNIRFNAIRLLYDIYILIVQMIKARHIQFVVQNAQKVSPLILFENGMLSYTIISTPNHMVLIMCFTIITNSISPFSHF